MDEQAQTQKMNMLEKSLRDLQAAQSAERQANQLKLEAENRIKKDAAEFEKASLESQIARKKKELNEVRNESRNIAKEEDEAIKNYQENLELKRAAFDKNKRQRIDKAIKDIEELDKDLFDEDREGTRKAE